MGLGKAFRLEARETLQKLFSGDKADLGEGALLPAAD